ncbi:aspartyl/asparaginyl-tRNA synthetase [Pararhizobium capsulatum DSM 1112]|uniref:Aspartyl/asparaginyl-tRNA synthetase n=1 Tax=Pararhizobium capsulatum DSM 1112 TaxID=1121113 RepID=A0ABU0BT58_9HYPH|nr:amino acid--tRNA ligase-related protein [Pararhizobium capsulatum]MDQ0321143.1 aspartyl/asparaginyl-tRNA synthetase [Pararhizobium capsulatum DSM 1112]
MSLIDRGNLIKLYSSGLAATRSWMDHFGAIEVHPPTLERSGENDGDRASINAELSGTKLKLSQGNLDCLIASSALVGKVYSTMRVFRPEEGRNRLLEFTYVSLVFPGDEHRAKKLFQDLISFVWRNWEASAGIGKVLDFAHFDFATACEASEIPADRDLSSADQLRLVEANGNRAVILTNKPKSTEPFRYEFVSDETSSSLFEVILPFSGEVGTGSRLELDQERLISSYKSSAFASDPGVEEIIRNLDFSLKKISSPSALIGFSYERLLQSFLGLENIVDAVPYPLNLQSSKIGGLYPFSKSMP